MWGNLDVYHFAAKMDGSGEIDYIKTYPEYNQNCEKIIRMIQRDHSFFGIQISNIEQGTEHRIGGGNINYVKFNVINCNETETICNDNQGLLYLERGIKYWNGDGVPCDKMQAKYWFEKAAVLGNKDAIYNLGVGYEYGEFGYVDLFQAFTQYHLAAEKGLVKGMSKLGLFLHLGKGCTQNLEDAFLWFTKAAEGGNVGAMYNLGVCYDNGKGVRQDYNKAAYWFDQAALKNYEDSAIQARRCRTKANM